MNKGIKIVMRRLEESLEADAIRYKVKDVVDRLDRKHVVKALKSMKKLFCKQERSYSNKDKGGI